MPSDHIKDYYKCFTHQKKTAQKKNARKLRKFSHYLKGSENAVDIPKRLILQYKHAEDEDAACMPLIV
jgi:hypothetical protein